MENVEKIEVQTSRKNWLARFAGAGAGASAVVATVPANASVDTLMTSISTDLGGVSTGVLSILTVLAGVTALLIGWAYVRRAR